MEYVQQFSPERVPEQEQQEEDEEDDDPLINYLRTFSYVQGAQPKKNDIIYYYDTDERGFMKVRIMSKSNYRYYYNIEYLESERPKGGVKLEPNGFWSRNIPTQNIDVQGHQDVGHVHGDQAPPVEEERMQRTSYVQKQVSPMFYQQRVSDIRPNRVYRLPEDCFRDQLSPKSRKRADGFSLAPEQEYMRSALAKSLAPARTASSGTGVLKAVKRVFGKKQ